MSPATESGGRISIDEQADHHSKLSNIFSFMKHQRHNSSDGVYLADLSSGAIDPAVAALYFTNANPKKSPGTLKFGFAYAVFQFVVCESFIDVIEWIVDFLLCFSDSIFP